MSELRQRRGEGGDGAESKDISAADSGYKGDRSYDHLYMSGGKNLQIHDLEDIIRMSILTKVTTQSYQKRAMSNSTLEVKEKLVEDPYNINLIKDLGFRYFAEFKWDLSSNVLLRGWKRVSELADPNERFTFLMKLCEASYREFKFKQAHAVLMDIDAPEDGPERVAYLLLSCHLCAQINEAPRTLSSFTKIIEGQDFEVAITMWAACALAIRKSGAFEVAKNLMASKVRPNSYKDESRMRTVEAWSVMKTTSEESFQSVWLMTADGKPPKRAIYAMITIVVLLVIYMFYCLEQRSLQRFVVNKDLQSL